MQQQFDVAKLRKKSTKQQLISLLMIIDVMDTKSENKSQKSKKLANESSLLICIFCKIFKPKPNLILL